jgi:transcriptional regulatory protein LEU3
VRQDSNPLTKISRFFAHYSPQVPIIDASSSPNAIFEQCPLLFWTLITVGSRTYSDDPTIFNLLSQRLLGLTFQSLRQCQTPIQIIQALLLLCSWPLPIQHLFKDKTHTLAGAAMQLALQIGLHVSGVGQDFARVRVQAHPTEQANRAILWQYCFIVCQRSVHLRYLHSFKSLKTKSDANYVVRALPTAFPHQPSSMLLNLCRKRLAQLAC